MPLIAFLLAGAGIVGGTTSSESTLPQRRRPQSVCAGVRVSSPQLERQPRDRAYSAREILDLEFRARFRRDLPGEHLLHLKVLTPRGFLYQSITLPFVSSSAGATVRERTASTSSGAVRPTAAPPPPRSVPGYPRPLAVQRLLPVPGDRTARTQYEVLGRLPVAGTSITLSSLYGRWTVQPYLDDERDPCGPAAFFAISE